MEDAETKAKILPHAWNQPQITECSHLLIFSGRTDISPNRIDAILDIASNGNPEIRAKMKGYEEVMRGFFKKNETDIRPWAERQTYIALGFAMAACAELHIDSCPIEGFLPTEIDTILGISSRSKALFSFLLDTVQKNQQEEKSVFRRGFVYENVEPIAQTQNRKTCLAIAHIIIVHFEI